MTSPTTRASYLPWWVVRRPAGHVADREQPAAVHTGDLERVVDGQRLRPARGRASPGPGPRSAAGGRWRRAPRRPRGRRPLPIGQVDTVRLAPHRLRLRAEQHGHTERPQRRGDRLAGERLGVRPAAGRRARRRVTALPKSANAVAISTPTTPPPRTASRAGTCWADVASRLVQGGRSASPSTGGTTAADPVATTTACRAVTCTGPSSPSTVSERSPVNRACPRSSVIPVPSTHVDLRAVVPLVGHLVATRERGRDVHVARDRRRGARDRRGRPRAPPRAAAAPWTACRPSTSTHRRPARPRPARRSARSARPGRRRSPPPHRRRSPRRRTRDPAPPSPAPSVVRGAAAVDPRPMVDREAREAQVAAHRSRPRCAVARRTAAGSCRSGRRRRGVGNDEAAPPGR